MADDDDYRTFRSLVDSADRKFSKVQSLPTHSHGPHHVLLYRKAFKAYTRLWRFQLDRRRTLLAAGLRRREIGEIASRIGQLYYSQYLRTSEARFLVESYVFYEAILSRGYFEAEGEGAGATLAPDLGLRCKELRFHARFLVVAMLLNRKEVVRNLVERFRRLLEDCKVTFPGTNFKEWKQVLQETLRFLKADTASTNSRPLRYNVLFDSHPSALPYIARFHARRELRLHDALLTSYHRNEVKLTEVTLDTYRMLQCLEWEPSGSFYEMPKTEPSDNGAISDYSGGASGLIDINLAADMIDSSLPPNPRKAILYHPSALHLISVLGTITEELSPDSVLLIYISASGNSDHSAAFQKDISETSFNSSKWNSASRKNRWDSSLHQYPASDQSDSSDSSGSYLILGSRGSGGLNNLYPEDLIPFTRRPLFLIIDSDNSHAFKAGFTWCRKR
ncbi:protein SCAI [Iris pallida]|uniref:Protein SCAI n=1 Tax=Iris pallida TaxID=29817 RepID=A0AAX6DIP5_IRIPA|nr:protein SCAI [Iris pallida]